MKSNICLDRSKRLDVATRLMGVFGLSPNRATRRWTMDAQRRTGQRISQLVRFCVRTAIFFPFFWSRNVMEMEAASWISGLVIGMGVPDAVRKTRSRSSSFLVRPGLSVVRYSQLRMAKKNAPMARSAKMRSSMAPAARAVWNMNFRWLGEIAFCPRTGSSSRSIPANIRDTKGWYLWGLWES